MLGAIVSPPDVVAPLAIARRLGLPRRILVILEGEGLANDATALILYRFAIVAIGTSSFSMVNATETFTVIVICEVLVRHCCRMAQPASAAMGARAAHRNHAVAVDALSRILGP